MPGHPEFHPYVLPHDIDHAAWWDRLFAALPDVVFCIKDLDFRYRSANQAFADRLGLASPSRIIGRTAEDLFPPHLAAGYRKQDERIVRTGVDMIDHLELVTTLDKSLGWYVTTKILLRRKDGTPVGIASISRDLFMPRSSDLEFAGVAKIVGYIRDHLDEALRPSVLARMVSMSQAQLDRRMRRVFRVSTAQFIRKSRIEHAARLLASTNQPIADIALACGYSDQSSFTRQFHVAVGLPPAAYRASQKSQ